MLLINDAVQLNLGNQCRLLGKLKGIEDHADQSRSGNG